MSLQQRLILSIGLSLLATLAFGSALAFWHAAHQVETEMQAAMAVGEHIVKNAIDDARLDERLRNPERLITEFNGNRHLQATLIDENQNSNSPYARADMRFTQVITSISAPPISQTGSGSHR